MAKTLRTLSDPDFTTKNNTLTWEEVDQNFIDIWNDPLEGLATADIDTALTNLGLKDGSRDLDLNSLDINNNTFVDSSRNITANGADFSDDVLINNASDLFLDAVGGEIYYNFNGDSNSRRIIGISDDALGTATNILSELTFHPEDIEWDFGESKVKAENFWAGKPTDSDPAISDTSTFSDASGYIVGDAGYILDNDNSRVNVISRNGLRLWTNENSGTAINAIDIDSDGHATFNERLIGANGAFVAHENGWVYNQIAGQNVVYNTDASTRNVWEIKRAAVGDTGTTNRLWTFDILSDDSIRWRPHASSENAIFDSNLYINGGLFAKEFVVEQTRVMFDFRMAPGGGKIESVTGSAGSETITMTDEFGAGNPLSAGAIVIIQQRTGQSSGTIIKKLVRKVDSISGMDATLTTSGISWSTSNDVGSIEAGDDIVYEGHVSDSTLDHYIHYDIANVEIPAIRFWDGVNDVGGGTEVMRVGGLDGFQNFGSQSIGMGIGSSHYLNGGNDEVSFSNGILTADNTEVGLAGFTATDNYIRAITGDTFVSMSILEFTGASASGEQFRSNTGFSVYRNDGDVASSDSFKWFRAGRISERDNWNDFSNNLWGVSIAVGDSVTNYTDIFRVDENMALIAGAFFDATGMWAGGGATSDPATKSDSNFWAKFDTGELFYDALVITVWARDTIAGFGAGSTADSLQDDEWTAQRASSTAGDNVIENKIKARYRHRFGINNMLLNYLIRVESSGDGTGTGAVYLRVRNQAGTSVASGNIDVGPTGTTEDTLEVDVSSLNVGQYYTVEVDLEAQVGNVNSGTVTITSHLREDAIIYATT